jgi:hypothetical protein
VRSLLGLEGVSNPGYQRVRDPETQRALLVQLSGHARTFWQAGCGDVEARRLRQFTFLMPLRSDGA